jgi:thioredoxin 1
MALEITQENFQQEVLSSALPVVIDVYAEWCGPCKMMGPIFDELAEELGQDYKFAKMNLDNAQELAAQYNVVSIPTFLFFKDGSLVDAMTGYVAKEVLRDKAKSVFL